MKIDDRLKLEEELFNIRESVKDIKHARTNYYLDNSKYTIMFDNNMVKIGHFDNTHLNSKVKSYTNIMSDRNEYFDIHYFLNTLIFFFIKKKYN